MPKSKSSKSVKVATAYSSLNTSSFSIKHNGGNGIIISGSDFITTVKGSTSSTQAFALANLFVKPGAFQGTKLVSWARTFERYRYRKMRWRFVPALPTSTAGDIALAYDRDIADATPPTGEFGLREYLAFECSKVGPVWAPMSLDCKLAKEQEFLYTSDSVEERESYQGQLYVVDLGGSFNTATTVGYIMLDYEIELVDSQLESDCSPFLMNNPGTITPSTADRAGWNQLVVVPGSNPSIETVKDAAGNVGINIPPGLFEVIIGFASAAAANSWYLPTIEYGGRTKAEQFRAVLTNDSVQSGTSGQFRRLLYENTGVDPVTIYGVLSTIAQITATGVSVQKLLNRNFGTF